MSGETPAPGASPTPAAPVERPAEGAAPSADGAGVQPQQQPDPNAQAPEGGAEGEARQTPEHRTVQGRISHYQKAAREAELRAARAEAREEALREFLGRVPQAPQAAPAPDPRDVEPNPEQYPGKAFDPQYLRDIARFDARQELKAEQAREETARTEQERQTRERETFEAGKKRFAEACNMAEELEAADPQYAGAADTLVRIARAEPVGTPGRLVDVISEAENPDWIGVLLHRQPNLVRELLAMTPTQRTMRIGAYDAQITANIAASQPKPAAAAPAPSPTPSPQPAPELNGRGAAPFNPNTASMDDYARWRNGQPR